MSHVNFWGPYPRLASGVALIYNTALPLRAASPGAPAADALSLPTG